MTDDGVTRRADDVHVAAAFASDVKLLAIGRGRDPFGLLPYGNDVLDLGGGDVDHAGRFRVLVGYVDLGSVLAEREFLGVRSGEDLAFQFPMGDIDDADAVGALVGFAVVVVVIAATLEDRIAMGVQLRRRGDRSAAHRYVDELAVRARMNTARALAHGNGAHHRKVPSIDDRDVVRALVGYVDLVGPGRHRAAQSGQRGRERPGHAGHSDRVGGGIGPGHVRLSAARGVPRQSLPVRPVNCKYRSPARGTRKYPMRSGYNLAGREHEISRERGVES